LPKVAGSEGRALDLLGSGACWNGDALIGLTRNGEILIIELYWRGSIGAS